MRMRCYSTRYNTFHYARSGGVSDLRSHAPYREAVFAPAYHSTMGVMRPLSYSTCYRYRACQGLLSALRLGTVEVSSWHVAVYGTGFLRQVRSSYKLCSTDHRVFLRCTRIVDTPYTEDPGLVRARISYKATAQPPLSVRFFQYCAVN